MGRIREKLDPFGWKIVYDWSFSLAALIAYNLLICLIPLILCVFAITTLLYGADSGFQKEIRDRLVAAYPQQRLGDVVDTLLDSISKQAGLIFVISFCVAIFTSSRLFICIDDVLTIIYRLPERLVIEQNIYAIKMLLAFIIFLPSIMILSSLPAVIQDDELFYYFLSTIVNAIFSFLFFYFIYHFIPNRKMLWKNTWCGGLFAAISLQILLLLFPIYVHQFMTNYVGEVGFIIIILVLFYLIGLLLVIGAQINAYFYDSIQPLRFGLGNTIHHFTENENMKLLDENSQPNNGMSTLIEGLNPTK